MYKICEQIQNDVERYKNDKEEILVKSIQLRLDKSLATYVDEVEYVKEYLKNRKISNLLRKF